MTGQIKDYLDKLVNDERVASELHKAVVSGALNSGEVADESELDDWFKSRFLSNSIVLVENDTLAELSVL